MNDITVLSTQAQIDANNYENLPCSKPCFCDACSNHPGNPFIQAMDPECWVLVYFDKPKPGEYTLISLAGYSDSIGNISEVVKRAIRAREAQQAVVEKTDHMSIIKDLCN